MGFDYLTRSLTEFVQDAQAATERVLPRMAERGADRMHELVVAGTPRRTGITAASWRTKPVRVGVVEGALTYESGIESHHFVARLLEHGTAAHEIPNRGVVSFRDPHTGREVTVRRVHHPGTPGLHLVAIAANVAEAEFDQLMRPLMQEWKRDAERA